MNTTALEPDANTLAWSQGRHWEMKARDLYAHELQLL